MRKHTLISSLPLVTLVITFSSCGSGKSDDKKDPTAAENERYDNLLKDKIGVFKPLPTADPNLSPALVNLGRHLYFDKRLSRKETISCNSCHNLATYGVDNKPTSPGDEGKNGERNSPTTYNAFLHIAQFWDGRAATVEEQAGMPILNPVEMNIPSEKFLMDRLSKVELYQKLFKEAFPNDKNPFTFDNLKKAIGAFERTLVTPTRFDKYLAGDKSALTLDEKKGLMAFITTGCTTCHIGPGLGGNMFQKFGVHANYWEYTKSSKIDEGKYAVTKMEADKYMFKVPSLYNVEKTYPYFHDGSVSSLEEAVKIMAKIQLNVDLPQEEIQKIVTFLKSLTAEIPAELARDPFQAS
ncbi:MAG: cytochrome-c peroxidase [Flavobacteriales bacterium]|nr:cytochrome-c peroxidase [Flavobacteriales bacterium]MDW8410906.1 cytochrome-c peroxidase [Flavobacteriales bacterium]